MSFFNFEGQKVVVTGGTRGIGREVSLSFLQKGASVCATYHRDDLEANAFKDSLAIYGDKLILKKFDVSNQQQVLHFYSELEERWDRLDILVNNSGIRRDNIAPLMSEEDWDLVINTNLKGTFLMSKAAMVLMMKNRYGRIISVSSVGGRLCLPGQGNYAASKAAQVALAQTLAKEVAKKNITVNCVCPGFIETELISDLSPEQKKEYLQDVPMKRFGKSSDVAYAILFLASKEANYISGTHLDIAGGL